MIDSLTFWGCVGSLFSRFGTSRGVFWRSWRFLGGSWEALGGSGGRLGSILGGMESPWVVWGLLGGSFGGLGGSWAALGSLLGGLEAVLDRSWAALSRHGLLRIVLEPPSRGRKSHWGVQEGPR